MQLASLLGPEITAPLGCDSVIVRGITADSRAVQQGFLFAALSGARTDGTRFISDAVARGACAILAGTSLDIAGLAVPVLHSTDPRRALALVAARFYRRQPTVVVAVTGTNGKTSVAEFARQIFATLGRRAASLGTIGLVRPGGAAYGALTTPDPVTLSATLAELASQDISHLALEASSHGLDQRRLDGVELAAAAFTNLGRDHLDYHVTADDYFRAKLRLFDAVLPPGSTAVVNADDVRAAEVVSAARRRGLSLVTTGRAGADLRLRECVADGFAQRLTIEHAGRRTAVHLPLIGDYQASNAVLAAGLAIAAGEAADAAIPALERLTGVRGRLDIAGQARGGLVVVDYAHKPEALAAALTALRPFARRRLICVVGCGGDRDKGKRPIMGAIAARLSDSVIVTDDNPRFEDPAVIRAEILAGAKGAREIGDRATAILEAVATLGAGDVVLVAGKGHETGQIVGASVFPFSDHDAVRAALARA